MIKTVNIRKEDTNAEILARIVKATSEKYDCTMKIDFQNGNRITEFIGDESLKDSIAEEVMDIFSNKKNK